MKRTARMLSWLLVLCLVVGLAPVSALAADGEKAIQLGTTAIEDPEKVIILNENNPEENTKTYYTPNSYIYFGNDNGAPILWRVLDAQKANDESTDGMFLLSEYLLGSNVQFDKDGSANKDQTNPNTWQKSDAQAWCTTSYGNFFTAGEKQGIVGVTKEETDASNRYQISWNPSALNGKQTGEDQNKDKLFFLSAQELYDYVGNYDGAPGLKAYTDSTETSAGVWWLRSPSASSNDYSGVAADDARVVVAAGRGRAEPPHPRARFR